METWLSGSWRSGKTRGLAGWHSSRSDLLGCDSKFNRCFLSVFVGLRSRLGAVQPLSSKGVPLDHRVNWTSDPLQDIDGLGRHRIHWPRPKPSSSPPRDGESMTTRGGAFLARHRTRVPFFFFRDCRGCSTRFLTVAQLKVAQPRMQHVLMSLAAIHEVFVAGSLAVP